MERSISIETTEKHTFRVHESEILNMLFEHIITHNDVDRSEFESAEFEISCGIVTGACFVFRCRKHEMVTEEGEGE